MPTEAQVPAVVAEVRKRLEDLEKEGVHLQVAGEKLDDDWRYVVVTPSRSGTRAFGHAESMSKVERELRRNGRSHLLLVPTLED